MSFLNPILAAVGLACVALPILIHILMRRRRKPVTWGAMRFLEQAYKRQRKRIRFEQWLLLASRCLLVAALALALGGRCWGARACSASDLRDALPADRQLHHRRARRSLRQDLARNTA